MIPGRRAPLARGTAIADGATDHTSKTLPRTHSRRAPHARGTTHADDTQRPHVAHVLTAADVATAARVVMGLSHQHTGPG